MLKRSLMVLTFVAAFSGSALASCPPPGSSPLGTGSGKSWGDWLVEQILVLIIGPVQDYQPMECTDVEIYFE